jgi:hypothetical protein
MRVYRPHNNKMREDERGTFDGWSSKFDEWVPVFSPRIMSFMTKCGQIEEEEVADDVDDQMPPSDQFKVYYAVPRPQVCISSVYLSYLNIFGNMGGFNKIIEVIGDDESEKKYENMDINVIGCLAQIVTQPYMVFHKKFVHEHGQKIIDVIKNRLILAPDQALRDVRKEQIDGIIKSVENISRRFLSK